MTIADAQLYRYRLPLTAPLSVGEQTLTERLGLLLRVVDAAGNEGWGEAAPLPGFSSESLEEATAQARSLCADLSGRELPASSLDALFRTLPTDAVSPSVRFAAETAGVGVWAAARGSSVVQALGGGRRVVPLNALITDSGRVPSSEIQRIRSAGYRAVKMKVGRDDVETDVARVRGLHDGLNGTVALRLDANRRWAWGEARAFADALSDVPLAYVEEPLRDPSGLADLVAATGMPVALDETTREGATEAVPDDLPIQAVILKPTLLGGIAEARRWAAWAQERGAVPVVSASYESGVGLRLLVALAASLSDAPAGLSTYTRLGADVLRPRLSLDGAEVRVDETEASDLDWSALAPVSPSA